MHFPASTKKARPVSKSLMVAAALLASLVVHKTQKYPEIDILVLPSSKNSNAEKSHILIVFQICFKWYGK
jgi:hypothetical protein